MTRWIRAVPILAGVALHIALALAIIGTSFRFATPATRHRVVRWWSGRLLAICGLRLQVIDADAHRAPAVAQALRPGHGAMLILNHVSWADIFVVHALRPARFVAKAEIARWPAFGYLTRSTGAIFIERGRRHAVREANHAAAEGLARGDLVGMFPEGTVNDGHGLLPFHANLIQSAIQARAPIVVAALRYRDRSGGPAAAMDFVGDVTLLQSLVRIAREGPVDVELHLIDVIEVVDGATATRHEVARAARDMIAERLGLPDGGERESSRGDAPVSRDAAPPDTPPGARPGRRGGAP